MGMFHRLPIFRVVAATLAFVSANAAVNPKTRNEKLNPEDARFWDRILEGVVASLDPEVPSQSPMALTPAPIPFTREPIATQGPDPTGAPIALSTQPSRAPIVQPTPAPTRAPITISPPPSPAPVINPTAGPMMAVCSLDVSSIRRVTFHVHFGMTRCIS